MSVFSQPYEDEIESLRTKHEAECPYKKKVMLLQGSGQCLKIENGHLRAQLDACEKMNAALGDANRAWDDSNERLSAQLDEMKECTTQLLYKWDALGKYKDDDFGKVESEMEKLRALLEKLK